MNKLLPIYIVLFLSLISAKVLAACSAHVGKATLNEIMKEGGNNGVAFIEIELLDLSITPVTYDQWTIRICHDEGNGNNQTKQCKSVSVADMNDATPWIWAPEPIIDKDYIDFQDGFDLSLLDGNGQFIDYIQIKGYSGQNFQDSCRYEDLQYVFPIPSEIENGTKILLRKPDGTGEWKESKNLNEYPPTPGGGNDGDPIIHHFEIDVLGGLGLTCEADQIIIKACADASCTTVNPDAVDVKLFVDNVENQTVTVSGENGTTVSYYNTRLGNVALSLDQTYQCKDSPSTPCYVDFRDAGFVFSTIADQVAGIGFSGINIQAVKDVNGVCTDLLSGSKTVNMAMEYIAPSRSTTNNYFLSGTAIEKNLLNTINNYTPIPLNFVANSTADLGTNKYDDAGQVRLHARYVEPPSNGELGFTIEGASNAFWVSPHHFSVIATNSSGILDGSSHDSTTKQIAGDEFSISFIAKNADDNATTNYIAQQVQLQLERTGPITGTAEGSLKYSNNQSISSELNSSLLYKNATDVIFDFNGEYAFNAATYSEVGLTKLYIRDNNYGSGSYKPVGIADIGRFIPDHFIVTSIVDGIFTGTCSAADLSIPNSDLPFVYSGQMFSESPTTGALTYFNTPAIVIEARNKNDVLTQNYIDDFFKLSLADFKRLTIDVNGTPVLAPIADAVSRGKDGTNLVRLTANIGDATIVNSAGEITYSYNNTDNFVYLHEENSEIDEFPADIDLSMVSIIDEDLVETLDFDGDLLNGLILTLNPTGKPIRFGRAQLQNSFGPETSTLPQSISVNYFKGGQYTIADDDKCTPYNATNMSLTNIDLINFSLSPPLPDISPADGKFIDETPKGITRAIELTAPGAGNTGQVCISYDILPWLQYKWATDPANLQCAYIAGDVDGLFNDNPFAIATFGIYRGNDRIIYQREIEKTN